MCTVLFTNRSDVHQLSCGFNKDVLDIGEATRYAARGLVKVLRSEGSKLVNVIKKTLLSDFE